MSLLLLGLAVGALLSACGSDDDSSGVSPDTWANAVCGQLNAWRGEVQAASTALETQMQASQANVESVRTRLVEYLDDLAAGTGQLVTSIDEAGIPDTRNGQRVAGELKDGMEGVKQAFDEAKAKAGSLPANDEAAFRQGEQEVSTSTQAALGRVVQRMQDLRGSAPELDRAFREAPECKQLSG